ncbi:Ger(x)C family spore germination protein [Oceanirhabdus sp. W0125-5]|uniref:Ger(x)C family spore germination protein n=1 Tax=Oceanirhabdus sp. W0125-5 TaxID=2999116 RepID=UPI0022F2E282|nr:Ger(x)C family spore germination protein [Oceanirhabdus sp. W0125-5]WBW98464.1 Ger(x)C family spore germination protein [Oceanirhabdus sp. W0125-5]
MKRTISKFILVCIVCCLLTGCWDNVEIDSKCFISTIGIDVGKDIEQIKRAKEIKSDQPFVAREIKKLKVTYGYPDMSQLGPEKGGTAESKSLSAEGTSMQDAKLLATLKSSRKLTLGQTKLLLLSNELLKYPEVVKEVMDYLQREPFLNRMMHVVVTSGKTADYISHKPDMEKNIEFYISGLMRHTERAASVMPMTVNEMLRLLTENGNVLIPRIMLDKETNEIILKGVAIIDDYELVGNLSSLETADLAIIRGFNEGGSRLIYVNGRPFDFSFEGEGRKIKILSKSKNKLDVQIKVFLEGQVNGYYSEEKVSDLNLEDIEADIQKSLSEECTKVTNMIQRNFGIEPFGIQEYLTKFKPGLWKEVKDNWEDVYKNSNIEIIVETKIRRIGVTD